MGYSTGCHTTFHHRYHLVWAPKYRFKVQRGEVRLRVREIIRQICAEMGGRRSSTVCSYATMSICSLKSRLTSRSATSSAAQKDAHCAKSSRSSNIFASDTGDSVSVAGAISPPHPTTSSCGISTGITTITALATPYDPIGAAGLSSKELVSSKTADFWSGRRDSNPRPQPWQF